MKWLCKLLFFSFLLVNQSSFSQTEEYMLKAGFLEKFARFSQWPKGNDPDTFQITVLGEDPFDGALEKMYHSHKIGGKPVAIAYISSVSEINNCHILFISSSKSKQLPSIIQQIGKKAILTVGETPRYAEKGVIINFYETNKGTIHFEISKSALMQSKVKMDIMLLDFAKLVE